MNFVEASQAQNPNCIANVFGAAVAPAICYLVWLLLRRPLSRANRAPL